MCQAREIKRASILVILAALATASCSDSNFSSDNSKTRSQSDTSAGPNDPQTENGTDANANGKNETLIEVKDTKDHDLTKSPYTLTPGDLLTLRFPPGNGETVEGKTVLQPLDVYFAIDVTGSMQINIDTIKASVVEFAKSLKEKGFDPNLGFIPFRDTLEPQLNLTKDMEAFVKFVETQQAAGGGDANEASLLGVKQAVESIVSEGKDDAVKAVLVITDNPGHTGIHGDCTLDTLLSSLNGLSKAQQEMVKIYHSTGNPRFGASGVAGSGSQYACSSFNTAEEQFNAVLDSSLKAVERNERGSSLPYPFTASVLLNDFVDLLEETTPSIDLVCLSQSAKLVNEGKTIATWKPESLSKVYETFGGGKKMTWNNSLDETKIKALKSEDVDLEISRCCLDRKSAKAKDFDGCTEKKQKISIKLKIKK
jgi:hypothetical protein